MEAQKDQLSKSHEKKLFKAIGNANRHMEESLHWLENGANFKQAADSVHKANKQLSVFIQLLETA